ncbi:MAG: tyrosine-type recombinase/integrase [Candidatus Sericytochromatia bacterium]|nr:tyrosine-type recombinase/integrase [Candidatus Sericytochromatia bacterium]
MQADFSIEDFLNFLRQRRLSQHTLTAYESDLKLVEAFLEKPLIQARERELFRYMATLDHLKATTVRRRLIAIKRFFDYAERQGYLAEDPAGNLAAPGLPKRLPKYMSDKEVKRLLDSLPYESPEDIRNMAIIKLLYYTGMRIGEVQQLQEEHILWDSKQLLVRGKGDKERLIPISQKLLETLEDWFNVRAGLPFVKSNAFFVSLGRNHRGKQISYGAMRQIVKRLLADAGLGDYSPHKLRHTFATQLLDRGAPLEQISKLLGHSRLDTTLIYAQTEPGKLRTAVELLG